MPLQIRRGTAAERNTISAPLAIGELLYVTDQGKLYIGDGTSLGGADSAGNPGQGGKGLIITGFTTEEAQDAMALAFANGSHVGVVFTYDDNANSISAGIDLSAYVGNVNIDGAVSATGSIQAASFKGSVFADDSTLLVDAVSGSIPYSVITGAPTALSAFTNDTGYITSAQLLDGTVTIDVNNTGDLQGSVFGDDSTLLVDAVNSIIPASVVSGTFTGSVIGNVTGNVTGNLTGDVSGGTISGTIETTLIRSADSSSIIVSTPTTFQSSVQIDGTLTTYDGAVFDAFEATAFPLSVNNYVSGTETSGGLNFRKSNGGSIGSPVTVNNGDKIGNILFSAFDGSNYSTGASIQARVSGTVSAGQVPMELRFIITDTTGTEIEPLTVKSIGTVTMKSNTSTTTPLELLSGHDSATSTKMLLRRSRTDTVNPTAVLNNDALFGISFQGWDGAAWRFASTIQTRVDGTVSSGIVPGKLEFATNNTSGTAAVGMAIDSSQNVQIDNLKGYNNSYVTFGQMPVLPTYANETAADAAIGGSGNRVNGMMYYDSGASKIKAVVGGAWAVVGP